MSPDEPRMDQAMHQTIGVHVHFEDRAYWATVEEYPGVFAAGDTLEELHASLEEGLSLVIRGADPDRRPARLEALPSGAHGVVGVELSLG